LRLPNSFWGLLAFLGCSLQAQISFAVDTLIAGAPGDTIQLHQGFILDSTLVLIYEGAPFEPLSVDPIAGAVVLSNFPGEGRRFIATYDYLQFPPPLQVGPRFKEFPYLDSLLQTSPDLLPLPSPKPEPYGSQDLFTTGTVFRSIELSPLGGTDLSGGLNLQLQGKLGSDLQVSGVLSDQSFPLQPEGNTQTLEEIDQVYLRVDHPYWDITAGDVEINYRRGKYMNIDRRLVGLKNTFKYNDWDGSAVYAGSKGKLNQMEFKGVEGKQGPYFLQSTEGSRDIVVLAGSERVWVDGEPQVRGENHDYIIDYATAELTFTARRLIHSDTDIYVEFQYSDFRFHRNLLGFNLVRSYGEKGSLGLSWLREYDNTSLEGLGLPEGSSDALRESGDGEALISGVQFDSTGDYIYLDSVLVYDPQHSYDQDHYRVIFANDPMNGSYTRRVSPQGKLYYEYVPPERRFSYLDLYSPQVNLPRPQGEQLLQLLGSYSLLEGVELNLEIALSDFDQNRLSSRDDGDNRGIAYEWELKGEKIALPRNISWDYSLSDWKRNRRFHALQRDRAINFQRDWNVTLTPETSEEIQKVASTFHWGTNDNLGLSYSRYYLGSNLIRRFQGELQAQQRWLPVVNSFYSRVRSHQKDFTQSRMLVEMTPWFVRPFVSYRGEFQESHHRFDHWTVGLKVRGKRVQSSLGLGKRVDQVLRDTSQSTLATVSDGYFGEWLFALRGYKGWTQDIQVQKRIKTFTNHPQARDQANIDFQLAKIHSIYRSPTGFLRWDLNTKLEKSYVESRATVYDSVGPGLGSYRYDPQFNEYIYDENGAYIAFTILTGDRAPVTALEGTQRLEFNLDRRPNPVPVSLRSEWHVNYQGARLDLARLTKGRLEDTSVVRSQWRLRQEVDLHPQRSNRLYRIWWQQEHDLSGLDPRAHELREAWEVGLDGQESLTTQTIPHGLLTLHRQQVRSGFSALRNRDIKGWWLESGAKWRPGTEWLIDLVVEGGYDQGRHQERAFTAYSRGVKVEAIYFLGAKGRFQARLQWNNTFSALSTLPPEALQGLPRGRSFRGLFSSHILLGENLSLNLTVNYISNQRYKDFINFTGELRAYF
jgi:hypothetical protein